jgi:hypothetical protein
MADRMTISKHAALVNRMAETNGVDLTEKLDTGRLSSEDWCDAVIRCTRCGESDACQRWLADHAEGAAETPGYCRNADLLAALRIDGAT